MRVFFLSIVLMQCACGSAFAQIAKIIEIRNEVMVKKQASSRWAKARVDTYLEREAEIKTGAASACMLAFDEQLNNILTIEENSQIRLENIRPAVLFLPRGRVFSLIEDIAKIQEFKVRTPVAIAGVRGTGDSIESAENGTTIKCFEGKAYVQLFDYYGSGLMERTVFEGLGVHIGTDGRLGEMFFLDENDYEVWHSFRGEVIDSRAERGRLPRSFYEQKSKEQREAKPFKKEESKIAETSVGLRRYPSADGSNGKKQLFEEDLDDEFGTASQPDKDIFDDMDILKQERRDDLQDNFFERLRKDGRCGGSSGPN